MLEASCAAQLGLDAESISVIRSDDNVHAYRLRGFVSFCEDHASLQKDMNRRRLDP